MALFSRKSKQVIGESENKHAQEQAEIQARLDKAEQSLQQFTKDFEELRGSIK